MIRTTYRGRALKVLAARGKPHLRKLVINGHIINHGWQGDDVQALDWFRRLIDRLDESGGPGNSAQILHGQYTSPHWWEPGAFDVNPKGHATQPGGTCLCSLCTIDDDKAQFAPLPPNACRICPCTPDDHNPRSLFLFYIESHLYKEPTHIQRTGRQAALDRYEESGQHEPPPCDAIYHKDHPSYLARPKCMLSADHREAERGYENRHLAASGFMWPRTAAA